MADILENQINDGQTKPVLETSEQEEDGDASKQGFAAKLQTYLPIITAVLSVCSALGVAWLSYRSAGMESELKRDELALERFKLDAEREKRDEERLLEVVTKLISPDSQQVNIGLATLRVFYTKDKAVQILEAVKDIKSPSVATEEHTGNGSNAGTQTNTGSTNPGNTSGSQTNLGNTSGGNAGTNGTVPLAKPPAPRNKISQALDHVRQTSNERWVIVAGSNQDQAAARSDKGRAEDIGFSAQLCLKNNRWFAAIGDFKTSTEAERGLVSVKNLMRKDAFVVDWKRWCVAERANKGYVECGLVPSNQNR